MAALERVLYVEDDPSIQMIARLALESVGGLTVCVCSRGDEALAAVTAFDPQLLLLDVMMPGMDGPSTLREIRRIPGFAETPAVFMTAKVQPGELASYLALGARDVIAKPFDPMGLPDRLKAIWQEAQA
ncbi:response regulator [Chitinibacteraceae bacterium HSL-7]